MRVLIGYDGSEFSDAALEDLKLSGLPDDSEAVVVTVADLSASAPPVQEVVAEAMPSRRLTSAMLTVQTDSGRVTREAAQLAESAAERLRADFPGWNVESRVLTGTPAIELIDAAREWNADLVVVGSKGRSANGQITLGSVSKKIATDAHCAVRVVRETFRKNVFAPPRIVVGVDGSSAAEEAVNEIGRRPWPIATEVNLVTVLDKSVTASPAAQAVNGSGAIDEHNPTQNERAEAMLHWATEQLKAIGMKVSISIQRGDAKRILLREARLMNADAIVIGSRGFRNTPDRHRLGSVSAAVMNKAECSVEVIRPPK